MTQRVLIFGAAGMVGQALVAEAARRGMVVIGAGRSGVDIRVEITDDAALERAIEQATPSLIINGAAIVDLAACEADPEAAQRVNAGAVGVMASAAEKVGAKFVQISTDHYFTGDGASLHDEAAPVSLINEYAKSKFAGEAQAMRNAKALVLRTNVTGFRGDPARPTFIEWAIDAIMSGQTDTAHPLTGFGDYYASTMDTGRFASALFDLVEAGAVGVLNVASREVTTKFAFLQSIAEGLGLDPAIIVEGSVSGQIPRRAESLGLDVSKAEAMLGYRLPSLSDVVTALLNQRGAQA